MFPSVGTVMAHMQEDSPGKGSGDKTEGLGLLQCLNMVVLK